MQICKSCGKEIKIIPTYNSYAVCEKDKEIFITELGYDREGYRLHKCEKETNDESTKQQNSTNQN